MDPRRRALLAFLASGVVIARARAQGAAVVTKPIPSTGEKLPVIGVGTWQTFDVGSAPAARAPLADVLKILGHGVVDSSPPASRSAGPESRSGWALE